MREVNRSFSSVITFFQYSLSDVDIRHDKFILAACLLFDRPEILSNLNFVYESRHFSGSP